MSASPGKNLLLRVNTTGSTFVTAGGLRTKQVKRSVAKVDVTQIAAVLSRAVGRGQRNS